MAYKLEPDALLFRIGLCPAKGYFLTFHLYKPGFVYFPQGSI